MKKKLKGSLAKSSKIWLFLGLFLLGSFLCSDAQGFVINVVSDQGNGTYAPIATGFRYVIEEDNSFYAVPGTLTPAAPLPDPTNTLAVNIHKSHSPVVCSGDTGLGASSFDTSNNADCVISSTKRYMVSVIPWHENPTYWPTPNTNGPWFSNQAGFGMSGRTVAGSDTSVEIIVAAFPVPTAQITVLVFQDTQPINGALDQPAESGLGGFNILLTDPIGKMMQDAWGNPLGTTYQIQRDGQNKPIKGANGAYQFILGSNGVPQVDYMGNGTLTSCPSGNAAYDAANCVDLDTGAPLSPGEAVIRFLSPNRYTAEIIPPANDPDWILTSTLEGTRANDAWVRAAEPRFNIQLGQLNWLVFYGYVKNKAMTLKSPTGKYGTITGQVVLAHDMHPPLSPGLSAGAPVPNCYVGLNNLSGNDEQVYTAPCNADSTFTISQVPPGLYQLVMWDKEINQIIDFRNVTVPPEGGTVALGQVAIYSWFGILQGSVFSDPTSTATDTNAQLPAGSGKGIANMRVNARYSDGALYASQLTNTDGNYIFTQFFPWWRWMIVESDQGVIGKNYGRFKSTGMTAVVDDGGAIPAGPYKQYGINPQIQTTGLPYRVQKNTNTQAMMLFQDMTNVVNFGKKAYGANDNGGISGFISYATSRTQENPEKSFWQSWEPGVPRVTVNLFKAIQDQNGKWITSGAAIATTKTTSFDDNNPTGCVEPKTLGGVSIANVPGFGPGGVQVVNGIQIKDCAETFRTWDQVRPGVYDGSYSFPGPLTPGNYIVQAVPPTGYKILKYGDRNIEFGEPDIPYQDYPPVCVGPSYAVPKFHQLFPDWQIPTFYPGSVSTPTGPQSTWYCNSPGVVDANGYCSVSGTPTLDPTIGPVAQDCTMRETAVRQGQNSIVDFRIFTDVPKSSRMWGWVSDDLHLESNPASPNASSNFAPSNIPVAIKDWTGKTVWRGYTDQWGKFEGLIPSTYTIFTPNPLGMSAGIYTVAVNDPGPIVQDSWKTGMPKLCDGTQPANAVCVTDPYFSRVYGQEVIRENWDFYAGRTTFIDTIVIPSAAVISRTPPNCDFVDYTPEIKQVDSSGIGPIIPEGVSSTITITSVGNVPIANPDGTGGTKTQHHGFGYLDAKSKVTVGGKPLTVTGWTNDVITATTPANLKTGELVVTRSNPNNPNYTLSSVVGVTLHVDSTSPVVLVSPPPANCDPYTDSTQCMRIQPAMNSALNGTIISVKPGSYMENLIFYKPVQLQGWGAGSTIIDNTLATANFPAKEAWNTLFQALIGAVGDCDDGIAPCITIPPGTVNDFTFEQGAGIMVASCDATALPNCINHFPANPPNGGPNALIDGLTITGATEAGGGVYVNSYAPFLKISNNEIYANQGNLSGGIRVGSPTIVNGSTYTSSFNQNLIISNNHITQNGSLTSGGGGVSLYKGCDNYQVTSNMLCGNFSNVYGGGILHFGLSPNGLIADNVVVSNESFDEGGGIMVAGELPIAGAAGSAGIVTEGAGSVVIDSNLIQGNKAGDDGGGVRTLSFNGQDIANNTTTPANWFTVSITNNMIVDNSSGDHGGGVSFDDTVFAYVMNNTIAHNDSTATGSGAFTSGACVEGDPLGQLCPPPGEAIGGLQDSTPRVGGVAAFYHSTALTGILAGITNASLPAGLKTYSNPYFYNNVVWQNRSYYWNAAENSNFGGLVGPTIWDMAIYGGAANASFTNAYNNIFTTSVAGLIGGANNRFGTDPLFVKPYFNVYEASSKGAAFGNFVNVYFTPIGLMNASDALYGDYHIQTGSPAIGHGTLAITLPSPAVTPPTLFTKLGLDYDSQARPSANGVDIGADQYYTTTRWFPW